MSRSCVDCIHCKQWSYSDTRDEPGQSGWECGHPDKSQEIEWLEFLDDEEASKTAESCLHYQQIDYAAIAKAEEEMEVQLAEDDKIWKVWREQND